MTTAPGPRSATAAPPARRPKGEGQWKLGYREPLNVNEQAKKDDDALNVRARIENIYAHTGFDRIDKVDLRNRFRWWGLYTQRKQGIDGGRTATLEPRSSRTPTSCSGCASTAGSSTWTSCARSPTSPPRTDVTPPT
jgi:sulfite reductase (ferredoxin)